MLRYLPTNTFPADREDIAALRIVIRNGVTHDLADLLFEDLRRVVDPLSTQTGPVRGPEVAAYSHGVAHRTASASR